MNTGYFTLMVVVGVLLLIAVLAGLIVAIVFIARELLGGRGSLGRLEESYPTASAPKGQLFTRQTIQIGAIVYQRCITLAAEDQGLYVARGSKHALIPWSEFKAVEEASLHWKKVPLLTAGDPPVATMTVPTAVYELMSQHLTRSEQTPVPLTVSS